MSISLEARLQRLEDIEEIRRVVLDYGRLLDAKDFKDYSLLFAENGEWDGGFGKAVGPKAIEEMMVKMIGGSGPMSRPNYHLMSSVEVEVDGDKGKAWSRWTFVMNNDESRPALVVAGEYNDTFVREKGRWKFQRRVVTALGPPPSS
jgi:3-phenylpropionate/cinnamic acid dioxygenase small subunit